jgi:hypothetical protein
MTSKVFDVMGEGVSWSRYTNKRVWVLFFELLAKQSNLKKDFMNV